MVKLYELLEQWKCPNLAVVHSGFAPNDKGFHRIYQNEDNTFTYQFFWKVASNWYVSVDVTNGTFSDIIKAILGRCRVL